MQFLIKKNVQRFSERLYEILNFVKDLNLSQG